MPAQPQCEGWKLRQARYELPASRQFWSKVCWWLSRLPQGPYLLTLPSYTLLHADELPADEPKGLIEGVLPQKGIAIQYGAAGSGKSFVTLDQALCVATGLPWHGHSVQQGDVLCIIAEGGHAFRKRVEGWQRYYEVPTIDRVRFILDAPDVLKGGLGAVQKACIHTDFHPRLVVIDTVKRTMLGDENTSRDVGAWDQACRTAFPDSCVIGVHHTGHAGDRARGSSAWRDHADTMFQIEQPTTGQVAYTCQKQRDWDDDLKMQLKLEKLQLPDAPDGTPRTTLVATMVGEQRGAIGAASVSTAAPSALVARLQAYLLSNPGVEYADLVAMASQGIDPAVGKAAVDCVWKG